MGTLGKSVLISLMMIVIAGGLAYKTWHTQVSSVEVKYPPTVHKLRTTPDEIESLVNALSYSQQGNLTITYHPAGIISGEYSFLIKSSKRYVPLYFAVLRRPDVLKLNLTIDGMPVNLSRLDRYELNISPQATIWVYVINVSTPSRKVTGKVTYELNYSKIKSFNSGWTVGTPLTWWAISGKGNLVNLTVRFPSGYIFFLPGYGLLNSTIKMKNFNINRIYGAFFMRVGKVQEISAGSMHITIYIPQNCQYSSHSLRDFERMAQEALTLYVNVTGLVPTKKFYILLNPSWSMGHGVMADTKVPVVIIGCSSIYQSPSVGNVVYSNPGLIFHELGHLWFGDYAEFGRIDESLATFMEFLAMSKTDKQYLSYLDDIENFKVLPNSKSMSLIYAYKEGILNPTIRDAIIYYKGAFVFRSLQFVLGNETFFKGLRELLKECHGKECNLTDIQNVFEKVSGQNLDWFFNEWFYTTKVPDYHVRNLSLKRENGKYLLTFEITDKNNFTMPLEVEVKTQTKSFVKRVWVNGTARVEFELNDKPGRIILDPDEWMVNENREYTLESVEIIIN